jgi:ATP-dependent DNA helicase RecQ
MLFDPIALLKQIWGYSEFRFPQGEIIQSLLEQRDTIAILPTGGGKSICFQIPALAQPGLMLVISPLVALMEDQVQDLQQRQIAAAVLHGELRADQRKKVLSALEAQQLKLLYLSPETLLSAPVWQRLCAPELQVSSLVLDEAHCLAQWGETFRPAYYRLGAVRSTLLKHKPPGSRIAIAAFTATADPVAQQTIQRVLQLENPQIFRLNPYRPNLSLNVQTVSTPRGRRQQLLKFVRSQSKKSGLVYVRTRGDSEELAQWFAQQGYPTAAYHAGLAGSDRRRVEQLWLKNKLQFVVCTNAFGMGINHPTVRWVAHFHAPFLLSEYIQEVGRAGRDGKPAIAFTLISNWLDSSDRDRWNFFEQQARSQAQTAEKLAHKIPKQGKVEAIARQFPQGALVLSLLHSTEQLIWTDPFSYEIQLRNKTKVQLNSIQPMNAFLKTRDCRWQALLKAFGFDQDLKCGTCDRCRE